MQSNFIFVFSSNEIRSISISLLFSRRNYTNRTLRDDDDDDDGDVDCTRNQSMLGPIRRRRRRCSCRCCRFFSKCSQSVLLVGVAFQINK